MNTLIGSAKKGWRLPGKECSPWAYLVASQDCENFVDEGSFFFLGNMVDHWRVVVSHATRPSDFCVWEWIFLFEIDGVMDLPGIAELCLNYVMFGGYDIVLNSYKCTYLRLYIGFSEALVVCFLLNLLFWWLYC